MMKAEDFLWVEKYRPKKIQDCILPEKMKGVFANMVKKGKISNMILAGGPGQGKTTVARAMLDEAGFNYIIKNSQMDVNMDKLRNEIEAYAVTQALNGKRKFVILDEADGLNPIVQPALRAFVEQFSSTCGFIFTCNHPEKILDALHSRAPVVSFDIPKEERAALLKEMVIRCKTILDKEGVEYDLKAVAEFVRHKFPDMRYILGELQRYANNGKIDSGIMMGVSDKDLSDLFSLLKDKNFTEIRKWVGTRSFDQSIAMRRMCDLADQFLTVGSIPFMFLLAGDYQKYHNSVPDKELNFMAFLVSAMSEEMEYK